MHKRSSWLRALGALAILWAVAPAARAIVPTSIQPVTDLELGFLNGAEYVQTGAPGLDGLPDFYRIYGRQVHQYIASQGQYGHVRYDITAGEFTLPMFEGTCFEYYRTRTCGIRGTITRDTIFFTFLVDGRPAALSPAYAMKFGDILRAAARRDPLPLSDFELALIDGAAYSKPATDRPGAKPVVYRIKGGKVVLTERVATVNANWDQTFDIVDGRFYRGFGPDMCRTFFQAKTCGQRGTITREAIHFTFLKEGIAAPLADEYVRIWGYILLPAMRQ